MIKEIEIFKFRNFKEGLKIEIGKHLTLISGKNGTSKTTLLGMLAKPFKGNEKDIYSNEMSGTFQNMIKKVEKNQYIKFILVVNFLCKQKKEKN